MGTGIVPVSLHTDRFLRQVLRLRAPIQMLAGHDRPQVIQVVLP